MNSDQGNCNHSLVGSRVMNRHRENCDVSDHQRLQNRGTITSVLNGCNALVYVKFDGSDRPVGMVPSDLAFVDNSRRITDADLMSPPKIYSCGTGRIDGFWVIATEIRTKITKRVRGRDKIVRARLFNTRKTYELT